MLGVIIIEVLGDTLYVHLHLQYMYIVEYASTSVLCREVYCMYICVHALYRGVSSIGGSTLHVHVLLH